MDDELYNILLNVRQEVISLRQVVQEMSPKTEAYDMIRAILLGPPKSQGMSIDVVWQINQYLQKHKGKETKND